MKAWLNESGCYIFIFIICTAVHANYKQCFTAVKIKGNFETHN